jgi:hypothetical protein
MCKKRVAIAALFLLRELLIKSEFLDIHLKISTRIAIPLSESSVFQVVDH